MAADLRDQIVTAAQCTGPPTVATGPGSDRTAGRAAGEVSARSGPSVARLGTHSQFGNGWPVAAALALVAVGAIVWALTLQLRLGDERALVAE